MQPNPICILFETQQKCFMLMEYWKLSNLFFRPQLKTKRQYVCRIGRTLSLIWWCDRGHAPFTIHQYKKLSVLTFTYLQYNHLACYAYDIIYEIYMVGNITLYYITPVIFNTPEPTKISSQSLCFSFHSVAKNYFLRHKKNYNFLIDMQIQLFYILRCASSVKKNSTFLFRMQTNAFKNEMI